MIVLKALHFCRKKFDNEIKNIFLHEKTILLKIYLQIKKYATITVVAENGIIGDKKLVLFNGQIISTKKFKMKLLNLNNLILT